MTSHPDVEALAFLAEELLEPDEESTVAAHVETCETCAATLDELTGVGDVLAAAPAPTMPQDVADLLDRRIAEAVRERSAEVSAESPVEEPADEPRKRGGATVVPFPSGRRGPGGVGLPRLLMVAAAAVVIGGGGAAVFNGVFSGGQEEAGVAAPLQENAEEEAAPDTAQSYTPRVVRSGTVYTEASLSEQAARTLDLSPVGGPPAGEEAEPMDSLETEPPGMVECAMLLEESFGAHFTLVDDAHYGDDTSRVWVLFTAPRGEEVEVYVVDPRCAQGGDAERSVLTQETIRTS